MTLKEQLLQEIEALPEDRLPAALSLIQSLHNLSKPQSENTATNLAAFLRTPSNTWAGDNEMREIVETTLANRSTTLTYNNRINPFE